MLAELRVKVEKAPLQWSLGVLTSALPIIITRRTPADLLNSRPLSTHHGFLTESGCEHPTNSSATDTVTKDSCFGTMADFRG